MTTSGQISVSIVNGEAVVAILIEKEGEAQATAAWVSLNQGQLDAFLSSLKAARTQMRGASNGRKQNGEGH